MKKLFLLAFCLAFAWSTSAQQRDDSEPSKTCALSVGIASVYNYLCGHTELDYRGLDINLYAGRVEYDVFGAAFIGYGWYSYMPSFFPVKAPGLYLKTSLGAGIAFDPSVVTPGLYGQEMAGFLFGDHFGLGAGYTYLFGFDGNTYGFASIDATFIF